MAGCRRIHGSGSDKLVRRIFAILGFDATRQGVLYSPKGTWRQTSDTGLTVNALVPSGLRTDIEDGACYNETFVELESADQ